MKLVRFIAVSKGISRREAMEIIKEGRVRIWGMPAASASVEVEAGRDKVSIDGKPVHPLPDLYFVMYKPRKTITSRRDPEGRRTVIDLLAPPHRRAFPIGRLDYNTTGVLLLTTDGELAAGLTRSPRVKRTYVVKLGGKVSNESFEKWRRGIKIKGAGTVKAEVRVIERKGKMAKVEVTVTRGPYHLIHKMAELSGMKALKIYRSKFAGITTGGLLPGGYRHLTSKEVKYLKALAAGSQGSCRDGHSPKPAQRGSTPALSSARHSASREHE